MDVDQVTDELYAVPPAGFTAARNAAADRARLAGDTAVAARIRKLRRPTLAAWLANLLTREYPDETRALLDLGQAMRAARDELDGAQLRALTAQRRAVVTALTRQARQAATRAGQPVGEGPLRELEETLEAVLADEQAADAFATGRLTSAQGPRPEAAPDAAPGETRSAEPRKPEPRKPGKAARAPAGNGRKADQQARKAEQARAAEQRRRRLAEARRRTAEAERAATAAEAEATAARRELEQATAQRERLERTVEELTARLEQARKDARAAAAAERTARGRVESTDRAARAARGRARDAAEYQRHLDSKAA